MGACDGDRLFLYTALNYLLSLPVAVFVGDTKNIGESSMRYWLATLWLFLFSPVLLPVIWHWLRNREWVKGIILSQQESAFDYYVADRKPVFMIIHLKDGRAIGGYWGPGSYASVAPNSGDIYLTAVYQLDRQRRFGDPVPATAGLLIRREEYSFIELFKVPGGTDDQERGDT